MRSDSKNQGDPRIERTKERAYEATLAIAAERGFAACTFDTVSQRSRVSRSTLYRHWDTPAELVRAALGAQSVKREAPDTGTLRDDMLVSMLGLAQGLQHSIWGALFPQLIAAGAVDPDIRALQTEMSAFHHTFTVSMIARGKARGEVADDVDLDHAALLFGTPIFYRHIHAHKPIDARWITDHVDRVCALIAPR